LTERLVPGFNVWTGIKQGGNDPTGTYTRVTGCDPLATMTVEAQ